MPQGVIEISRNALLTLPLHSEFALAAPDAGTRKAMTLPASRSVFGTTTIRRVRLRNTTFNGVQNTAKRRLGFQNLV